MRSIVTLDIDLREVCGRVGGRYVITKFSRMDSLPNFLTHGTPLRARESSAINANPVFIPLKLNQLNLFLVSSL